MLSDSSQESGSVAIEARGLGKRFSLFEKPSDRLKQLLFGRYKQFSSEFWALQGVDFDIRRGEVVGLVGRNGAGKSTLLQLVCGTLSPTSGTLAVRGRVAALLELGAGFSPDFTGLENVYMNAAILGLSRRQVDDRLDSILAFADIGRFIDQPVKTYSSGMFVRLAFAVATSVEPDILVIDEALSVGDGAFARKSFDRIMDLKEGGATILFCSHSMYHIQALCSRVLWLENGKTRMWDAAARVTSSYETSLVMDVVGGHDPNKHQAHQTSHNLAQPAEGSVADELPIRQSPDGTAIITRIDATADGASGLDLAIHSGITTLVLRVQFESDPKLPCPSLAVGIAQANGSVVASAGSFNDNVPLIRDARGAGEAYLTFERLALLRGDYSVSVILGCERGLHAYEIVEQAVKLHVVQIGLEQGVVSLPHSWSHVAGGFIQ